jgi:hypothetical protein
MESRELLLLQQENISENQEPTSVRMNESFLFILNVLFTGFTLLLHVVTQGSWKCEMYFFIRNIQYYMYILSPSSLFIVIVKDMQLTVSSQLKRFWFQYILALPVTLIKNTTNVQDIAFLNICITFLYSS